MRASDIQQLIINLLSQIDKSTSLELTPGQIITVLLKDVQGDMALLNYQGKDILARIEMEADPGQRLKCLVEGERDGQILLKVLSGNREGITEKAFSDIISRLGLTEDKLSINLLGEMIKQGMPLTADSAKMLSAFMRNFNVPENNVWIPIFMLNQSLPLTEQVYRAVTELFTNNNYLHNEVTKLSGELQKLVAATDTGSQLRDLATKVNDALQGLHITTTNGGREAIESRLATIFEQLFLRPLSSNTHSSPNQNGQLQFNDPPKMEGAHFSGLLDKNIPMPAGQQATLASQPVAGQQATLASQPVAGQQATLASQPVAGQQATLASQPVAGQQVTLASQPVDEQHATLASQPVAGQQSAMGEQLTPRQSANSGEQRISFQQSFSGEQSTAKEQPMVAAQLASGQEQFGKEGIIKNIINHLAVLMDRNNVLPEKHVREQILGRFTTLLHGAGKGASERPDILFLLDKLTQNLTEHGTSEYRELSVLTKNLMDKLELIHNFNNRTDTGRENTVIVYSSVKFDNKEEPLRMVINYQYDKKKNKRDFSSCRVEIKLNTPGLGLVRCEVQFRDKTLTVQFISDNEYSAQLIDKATEVLADRLTQMKFYVKTIPCKVKKDPDYINVSFERQEIPGLFQVNLRV